RLLEMADAEERLVVRAVERLGDAIDDLGEEGIGDFRHQDADGVASPPKRPGRGKRTIVEVADGLLDASAERRAYPVLITEHLRDGSPRYPGSFRYRANGGTAAAPHGRSMDVCIPTE